MEKEKQVLNISETLLKVFQYAFVESAPYSFFIPTRADYVAVNLQDKVYHCLSCGHEFKVKYKQNGVVYFSKGRFEKQRAVYERKGLAFPDKKFLREERSFTYHEEGYCAACAPKELAEKTLGQDIYNLCYALHQLDRRLLQKGEAEMRAAVERWVLQIKDSSQLAGYDLSSYEVLKDLICAVILEDLSDLEACLADYKEQASKIIAAATDKLEGSPDEWQCHAARSTVVYESMSDELYHEYTVVFPEEGTLEQEFYIEKKLEKARVQMFLAQKRVETIEELILEIGFMDEWVDLFIDHAMKLEK